MNLKDVDRVDTISPDDFRENYFKPRKPLIINNLTQNWPARHKWSPGYFKQLAGNITVPVYDNSIPTAASAVNAPDKTMTFGEYLDIITNGPSDLRIFLFNIFQHVPELCKDFDYPSELTSGFLKKYPMMFFGGCGSKVYLHFDIDLSHVFITQFTGRKKVILFDQKFNSQLYKLPFMVQSYIDPENPDYTTYPALKHVEGYQCEIAHGETLYMPSGMWHYMYYQEGGYALSLRSIENPVATQVRGAYNLFVMRKIDDFMKRYATKWWYNYKHQKAVKNAAGTLSQVFNAA